MAAAAAAASAAAAAANSASTSSSSGGGNADFSSSSGVGGKKEESSGGGAAASDENLISSIPHIGGMANETNHEISARLLFMAVKWTKNLTSFASLPFRDQVTLLEESWSELFLLCAIQWSLPFEKPTLFHLADFEVLSQDSISLLKHLTLIFSRFKSLNVNPAEFACMKAILLFKPGKVDVKVCLFNQMWINCLPTCLSPPIVVSETSGLKDTSQVENLQDQALGMLKNHIEASSSPKNLTRFGRLLMLLVNLRVGIANRVEKAFFEKIIGNAKMEKLLCDMFQS